VNLQDRYAIVTPYYREDRSLLQRCINSVKSQSVKSDHFLIADGHPQSWIDHEQIRHIKLDRPHGDYGNTPRGIGALVAIAEEYDGIGFLDGDNWLDNDHIEACLEAASKTPGGTAQCDYVVAQMRLRRPDETVMPLEVQSEHVDTSCFFFLRGSFSIIPHWALMPKVFSVIGDRIFYQMLKGRPFRSAYVQRPTSYRRILVTRRVRRQRFELAI
jgi:glycosyltransferase involved in cell wall biosynthesis